MKFKTCLCVGMVSTIIGCAAIEQGSSDTAHISDISVSTEVLQYVDPMIGTGGHGHTFPGATVPFGKVQLSPDNPSKGWDWTSGYNYSDDELLGFSHTHLSGTGVGDLLDILFMPFRGDYQQRLENDLGRVVSKYNHADELATAGYYSLQLPDEKVKAELTVTERTGVHKYTYSGDEAAKLLIDLGYAQNYDKAVATFMRVDGDNTLVGYRISTGWTEYQPVYFVAKFNQPFKHQFYVEGKPFDESTPLKGKVINTEKSEVVLDFGDLSQTALVATVGISYSSIEHAKMNLNKEIADLDFEKIKDEAEQKWAQQLNKFVVEDADIDAKTIFYTALYHSFLAPQIFNDVDGSYFGADGATHQSKEFNRYTLFSLWDTFRALQPLLTISDPQRVNDMVHSMLAFYDETGLLPTWDLMSNETDVMIGYHAVPVLVDAYFKGLTDVDPKRLYAAVKASAMQDQFGIDLYKSYGYIPSELELEAVSKTLEYAFDDWAIARLAEELGESEDAAYFSKRAESFKTLFDESTGFMRGKDKQGKWVEEFSPTHVDHRVTDYTEANAWQYTWFVPHDVNGLINLYGGESNFIHKLDELFTTSSFMEGDVSPDISGLIGQYAHGNEPCHHVPYLYAFTSQKWKGEQRIREIRKTMYRNDPDGLAGNDDVGQMSSWYVFSALGFYPVNPANGEYVFGTPLFDKVTVNVGNGKSLVVSQSGDKQGYVKRIELNGVALDVHHITHAQLETGGELHFVLGK